MVVAPVDRKVRIEVGLGLQDILTNAVAKRVIEDVMIPHFRAGDFSLEIVSGIESIIGVIEKRQ